MTLAGDDPLPLEVLGGSCDLCRHGHVAGPFSLQEINHSAENPALYATAKPGVTAGLAGPCPLGDQQQESRKKQEKQG